MSKGQKSFVKGAAILGLFGLIVKVIGAVFRIPLTNVIGSEGIANYNVAYPLYALLVVISTAGLPAAISRMVAERVSLGDYRGAHNVFKTAFKVLLAIGIVSTVILLLVAKAVAVSVKIPSADLSLMMIAPALFFVAILSAYRGYFQGLQIMMPTALTQVAEQVVKLVAGLYFAFLWVDKGVEWGAAGALLGVSISEVFALAIIVIMYNFKKKDIRRNLTRPSGTAYRSKRSILSDLVVIAVPVTIGSCIMPIVGFLDTAIITNVMSAVDYSAYSTLSPTESFGVLTGTVNPLINMPAVLSLALCMSLVPAISEARSQNNPSEVSSRSAMGFKLAVLIGLPCAVGMYILAKPIIMLLFSSGRLTMEELTVGADMLKTLSIGVLFLTMLQTMTGILQGAGHQFIPVVNLLIGAAIKVVLSVVLMRVPSLNINGAAIGTAACYGVAALLNVAAVIRHTKPGLKVVSGVLTPVLSTAVMGVLVYLLYVPLASSSGNTLATLVCIAAAVVIYVIMLFVTGALSKEDMKYIPGGRITTRFMNSIGLWEK